jgi:hypothetical protein
METTAQARRSAWLRRIRSLTTVIATLATGATLLIAAVVGRASPATSSVKATPAGAARRAPVARPTRTVHRRARVQVRRTPKHAAPHKAAVAKPRVHVAPPPPDPAPVVVSGGS